MIHFNNARLINPETLTDDIGSLTTQGDTIHALNAAPPEKTPQPPTSDARIGGMVATVVLILLFIFVGVFVWVGS